MFTALRALDVRGEVITIPFTFPATYRVPMNLPDVTPVFADVSREDCCTSPEAARSAITPPTAAILPVHAYGFPCDAVKLGGIAEESGVRLVYDAAPSTGVKLRGTSIVNFGDACFSCRRIADEPKRIPTGLPKRSEESSLILHRARGSSERVTQEERKAHLSGLM